MTQDLDPMEQRAALSVEIGDILSRNADCLGNGRMTLPIVED